MADLPYASSKAGAGREEEVRQRAALAASRAPDPVANAGSCQTGDTIRQLLERHEAEMRAKGRNPLDYTSKWKQAADVVASLPAAPVAEAKHIEDKIRSGAEEIEKEAVSATWSAAIKAETAWSPETNSTPWCLLTVEQMRAFEASTGQMMRLRQDGEWHPHNGNGIGIVSDTYRIRKGGAE